MSKFTHVIEDDLFNIDENSLKEKLDAHMVAISKTILSSGIKNAKIITRVKELSYKQAIIHTEVEEEMLNILLEKKSRNIE